LVVTPFTFWLLVLVISGLALAQQGGEKKDAPPPADQKEESPLFKKKLGIKSSNTSKGSTTLGFNGIDPSGKVDQKMMATNATTADQEKVKNMSANRPTAADLKSFLQEGGLSSK
jgi:hypothetical protein